MAKTPEDAVKDCIREILAEQCVYYTMPVTSGYGKSGGLDFSCTVPPTGTSLQIEAKSIHTEYGRKGPTTLQLDHIQQTHAAGGIALVINETNYDLLREVLHDIADGQLDRARARSHGQARELTRRAAESLQGGADVPAPVLRRRR